MLDLGYEAEAVLSMAESGSSYMPKFTATYDDPHCGSSRKRRSESESLAVMRNLNGNRARHKAIIRLTRNDSKFYRYREQGQGKYEAVTEWEQMPVINRSKSFDLTYSSFGLHCVLFARFELERTGMGLSDGPPMYFIDLYLRPTRTIGSIKAFTNSLLNSLLCRLAFTALGTASEKNVL